MKYKLVENALTNGWVITDTKNFWSIYLRIDNADYNTNEEAKAFGEKVVKMLNNEK